MKTILFSNSAPPTMNIATNRITLLSIYPANAVLTSRTPVTTSPIQTISQEIGLVWKNGKYLNDSVEKFIDYIKAGH